MSIVLCALVSAHARLQACGEPTLSCFRVIDDNEHACIVQGEQSLLPNMSVVDSQRVDS